MIRLLRLALMAGLGMAGVGTVGAQEPLGRLFFTPEQRAALDAGKRIAIPKTGVQAPAPVRRPLDLRGVVVRSDGERTVWVNGRAYHDDSPEGVELRTSRGTPGKAEVRVPGQGRSSKVKVGQQLDLNSGKVHDSAPRDTEAEEAGSASANPGPIRSFRQKKKRAAEDAVADGTDRDLPESGGAR